ncbi:hypothetical protein [Planomonospora parontospora]|uniref:hypothetical protein n=1 Tax=Planomonospora parontospora TaxID=58119 RepID=UPI00166FA354|nr:hypothetical protein [Planomonospora parontospora]GGL33523.1 hypothetical protein GCM10014719_38400 [Planomonospora parontospora subsp. antibiotica]GII16938.1 hypothetical protein Ppa05_36640 [Planomonospora parontospora subsp. antibiotica]
MPAPDVAALLADLERSDPDCAEDARGAIEWLSGGEPLETITELAVCEFLWYTLPTKVSGDRPATARALGRLLRLGGLERYAALCSSSVTAQILRTYARAGEDAGIAAYQAALDARGVLPPDVPELRWSSIMGPEELGAHGACSAALELAIVSGELAPGSTRDRTALTRRWLTTPRAELGGDNWLHRVQGERLNRWVLGRGAAWRELAQPFEVRLHAPIPAPAGEHLAALRWLLRRGREPGGVPLVPAPPASEDSKGSEDPENSKDPEGLEGPQDPAVVPAVPAAPSGTPDRWNGDELAAAGEAAQRMGALDRDGRALVTTAAGRRLLGDAELLWEAATTALLSPVSHEHDLGASAREVALMLLADGLPADRESVASVIGCEEERRPEIDASLTDLTRLLDAFGLRAGGELTPAGRAAALAALRGHALRPRRYVSMG